jgi:uncharacterized membrane protein SirB2
MSLTQLFLIIHLLAIAMALGIGVSNIVGFRVAKGLGGDMAKGIAAHREALIPYGDTLFLTVIASGLVLFWLAGAGNLGPWFSAKMVAVAVWIITYVAMRLRIRRFLASRDMSLLPLIRTFAHVLLAAVVATVICAVMAFNA